MSAETTHASGVNQSWDKTVEPLALLSDHDEYRSAYEKFTSGQWDDEQWTAFRLRYGIYGQLQSGVQMVRVKVPGGVTSLAWLRSLAEINREFCNDSDVHITTRQDFQLYYLPLERSPDFLEKLYGAGMTTREACGNTLRNMTSCHLAGVCPREHTDAGKVASQLAAAWLRNPLVQHMPRKFKASVSGCQTDCGAAGIHDMTLVATDKNGEKGFIVYGGGGTGGQPISAVKVADFISEEDAPVALEALVRLHQRYSNRINRNQARIKFLVKRFGEEKFRELFEEEFERVRALPQRPWEKLDWREPEDAPEPTTPGGVISQHDGKDAIVVCPSLGLLTSDQLDALADLAEKNGIEGFRLTRDQNFVFLGVPSEHTRDVVAGVEALGFPVEKEAGAISDVVSCPGTTTCRIGITNSQSFGLEVADYVRDYKAKPGVTVRISGCQNGCGLHHVGDFGFRGMGKKIEGRNAPHYQVYVGGNPRKLDGIAVMGPFIAARFGPEALRLLMDSYAETRQSDESIRDWAERHGKEGLAKILGPVIEKTNQDADGIFTDWGEEKDYAPPPPAKSECAATFAIDNLLRDMADDALIGLDRSMIAGSLDEGRNFGRDGIYYASRRFLARHGDAEEGVSYDETLTRVRALCSGEEGVVPALEKVVAAQAGIDGNGGMEDFREALAHWVDLAYEFAAKPLDTAPAGLDDSSGSVMAIIHEQGGS